MSDGSQDAAERVEAGAGRFTRGRSICCFI